MTEALVRARALGFLPRTVIDVGVANGTPELYDPFPNAHILLIEPLEEYEDALQRICQEHDAEYVLATASTNQGTTLIHVHSDLFGSSLLREIEGSHADGVGREVPTVRIDDLCRERNLTGPFLIKIDVQGAELMVLEGATETLRETEYVILEVSLFGTLMGGPQLHEAVAFMKQRGFVVYDLFGGLRRPLDGALAQLDIAFVKDQGPFRTSHAYATPEQRRKLLEKAQAQRSASARDRRRR